MNIADRLAALSAEELAILRERARVAGQKPPADESADLIDVLEVQSREQKFALPLTAVEGIIELSSLASVPQAPVFVRGLVSFRGEVLVGIELSALVGGPQGGIADLRRAICLSVAGRKLAILAERVMAVRSVRTSSFHADPVARLPFVIGADQGFVALLDPASLIQHAFDSIPSES